MVSPDVVFLGGKIFMILAKKKVRSELDLGFFKNVSPEKNLTHYVCSFLPIFVRKMLSEYILQLLLLSTIIKNVMLIVIEGFC